MRLRQISKVAESQTELVITTRLWKAVMPANRICPLVVGIQAPYKTTTSKKTLCQDAAVTHISRSVQSGRHKAALYRTVPNSPGLSERLCPHWMAVARRLTLLAGPMLWMKIAPEPAV